jgi:hypothetical protein
MNKIYPTPFSYISGSGGQFKAFLRSVSLLLCFHIMATMQLSAQYNFSNQIETGTGTYTPTTTNQTVSMGNNAYVKMNVLKGGNYHWDVCGFTGYDTYLNGLSVLSDRRYQYRLSVV